MAHLPSPASASSSTLIVTSLPSKESIQLQVDDISPSDLAPFPFLPQSQSQHQHQHQPQAQLQLQRKLKPKPALAITIAPPTTMSTTAPNEPKMSAKGFVEPHHGHLPRRSKKREKTKGTERETPPDLSRGVTSSTIEGVAAAGALQVTSSIPVSATTAKPVFAVQASAPAPAPADPTLQDQPQPEPEPNPEDPDLQSPPHTPPPPIHPYIPRHELLPPIHLTSLKLPPSPPPPPVSSFSSSALPPPPLPHPSAAAPLPSGVTSAVLPVVASPAFATPGTAGVGAGGMGGTPTLPNLPRRRVSAKRNQNQNQRRQSEGKLQPQPQPPAQARGTQDAGSSESEKGDERVVSGGGGEGGGRRGHTREGALYGGDGQDDFGSTSSQTSASPSASAGRPRSRSQSHSRTRARIGLASPTPGPLKLRARSQSRTRARLRGGGGLGALDEGGNDHDEEEERGVATPTTSARLFVGQRSGLRSQLEPEPQSQPHQQLRQRSRGVSLPRLRLRFGESPLRTSFPRPQEMDVEGDVFMDERTKGKERDRSKGEERRAVGKEKRAVGKTEKEKERERFCLQEVGRGSGVEVGFLDGYSEEGGEGEGEEERSEAVRRFWGLEMGGGTASSSSTSIEGGRKPVRRVVLRVVDDSSTSFGFGPGPGRQDVSSADSGAVDQPPSSSFAASSTSDEPAQATLPPPQTQAQAQAQEALELILDLPDDLPSYRDGQTALSAQQLVDGCRFIHECLSSASSASSSSSAPSKISDANANKQAQAQQRKKKIRILTPRARPEDGMSLALCYLAYHPSSRALSSFSSSTAAASTTSSSGSCTLLESLHRYFRGSNCHILCSASAKAEDEDNSEDEDGNNESAWYHPLSPAHLLYMRLLDEGDGSGSGNGSRRGGEEEKDPRGRETSRRPPLPPFVFGPYSSFEEVDVDVDVVGDSDEEGNPEQQGEGVQEKEEEEYAGIRNEWRGVLSFEGLERVDEAGRVLCGLGSGEEVVVV